MSPPYPTVGWGSASSPRVGVINNPSSPKAGMGMDPTVSLILTPHRSCDLTPPMHGTELEFGLTGGPL